MEFGVLELGLKNKQISNINIFLRIQSEGFKVKWLNYCNSENLTPDGLEIFRLLFKEWDEVFIKINHVLKHEYTRDVKLSFTSTERFGHLLVKISIQVINQLIMTLNIINRDEIKNEQLNRQTVEFERCLLKHSRYISSYIDSQFERLRSTGELNKSFSSIEFNNASSFKSSQRRPTFGNQQLSKLLEDELMGEDFDDWNVINKCALRKVKELVRKNDLKSCEEILVIMGLPVQEIFYFIAIKSFDKTSVNNLLNYFKLNNIYPGLVKQIELQNKIWSLLDFKCTINFISLTYTNEEKIKNLIISELIDNSSAESINKITEQIEDSPTEELSQLTKLIDDRTLFNFLLNCNERERIVTLSTSSMASNTFNKIQITETMLDYCLQHGQELTKQHLLHNLAKNKIYPNLIESPNLILKRLYSNCDNKNTQNFCILCKSGLFANFKSHQFQEQLIDYAIKIKQFDFVYWFLKQENNIKILRNSKFTDPFVKNVILSLFDYRSDSQNSVKLLNIIVQYCKYFNQHLTINNINDLFENGLVKEAISCMFLAPTSFNDLSLSPLQIWYMKPDVVLNCLKQYYPILFEAFNQSLNDQHPQLMLTDSPVNQYSACPVEKQTPPHLYSLLKGAIIFDINKLFYWQSMNIYATDAENRTMPTFSNTQLAEKFGLKATETLLRAKSNETSELAQFDFRFYLTRGRPIEAYYQEIVNKDQKDAIKIQSIYKKACLLAFYNCGDSSIVCSCVAFLELLHLNSASLTFQIAISRLIMKYASDFLTLKRVDQQEKMGDLLNKACFEENKLAQTNILELIYIALDRKYERNEKPLVEECIDYEIAVLFARKYSLDLPTQFLLKCLRNDEWLLLTVYIQIYDYPKDVFEHLLKDNSLFNSSCVAEHLSKAFSSINHLSDSHIELTSSISYTSGAKQDLQKQNFSRTKNNLYQRIVKRKMQNNKLYRLSSSPLSVHSPELTVSPDQNDDSGELDGDTMTLASSQSEYDGLTFDSFNTPKNLFNLLMMCHKANSIEPWKSLLVAAVSLKNPVPALIAASVPICDFESEHLFECCCCWLFASFKLDEKQIKQIRFSNEPYFINWSFRDFELLLSYGLRSRENLIHFYHALQLFVNCNRYSTNRNPLIELVKFLIEFLLEKNYHESLEKLLNFKQKLKEYQSDEATANPLYNKSNISQLCFILVDCSLRQTSCLIELHLLLQHFEISDIQHVFNDEIEKNSKPTLVMLYQLIECIHQTDCLVDMNRMLNLNIRSIDFMNYMKEIVENLQKSNFFKEAKEFARICELDIESIILNEFLIKSESQSENFDFWVDCLRAFINNRISFKAKQSFLCGRINSIQSRSLKCYLLFNLISDNKQLLFDDDDSKMLELHLEFWNYLIDLEHDYQFLSSENILSYSSIKNTNKLSQAEFKAIEFIWSLLIKYGLKFETMDERCIYKSPSADEYCLLEKEDTLCKLMDNLLNNNCMQLTYKIANLFKFRSLNLEIIQYCTQLVQVNDMKLLNLDLSSSFKKILERVKEFYEMKLNKFEQTFDNFKLNLQILENLYEQMTFGRKSLQNIILMYKISNLFCMKFYSTNDDESNFKLLVRLIEKANKSTEHFQLAKEFTQLKNITDKRIVNYVCENIEEYLLNDQEFEQTQQGNQEDNPINRKTMSKTLVIIRLLNDPAVLGKRFMHIMNSYKEISLEELSKVIELCIKAHECFKLANDIEGIATVLQKVRALIIKNLSLKQDYDSMIRLLIGINRYSEMAYVFDILKDNHQLELLLSKKVIKNLQLRIALIDFLKSDREMYQMIALNFSMHREIAELLEHQAKASLKNLKLNANTLTTYRTVLEDIMQELIDASESYARADCFTRSDACAKLAQLIALQINYANSSFLVIINLTDTQAIHFVNTHPKFFEAHIVANAYGLHHNWCIAFFNNIILNGDWQYYRDYSTYYKLSTVNFEEIMSLYSKFKKEREKTIPPERANTIKQNVQKLVMMVKDLKLMYKYSMEHNLINVSASLVDCPNVGYIRDLKRQNKI